MRGISLLLALFLVYAAEARPTRVFIDVNNSFTEVEKFKAETRALNEEAVIIPQHDRKAAEEIRKLQGEQKKASAEYTKLNCFGQMLCGGSFTAPSCQKVADRRNKLDDRVRQLTSGKISPEAITEKLKSVYKNGGSVNSIVLSGEDGGSVFGAFGRVDYKELRSAFAEIPQLKNDVKSLYLWGCYMGTAGNVNFEWKEMFPGAKVIVGFHDSGPADGSPPSLELMTKAMATEKNAFNAYGEKAVTAFFKSMRAVAQMNTSMCINDHYVDRNTNFSLKSMDDVGEKCKREFPAALKPKYDCYMNADDDCPNPPKDHNSSDLRLYYSFLRKNQYCLSNPVFYAAFPNTGGPDSVMRLIYYDRVWSNFLKIYGNDMKKLNSLMKALGYGPDMEFTGGPNTSRQEFRKWFEHVREQLAPRDDERSRYVKSATDKIYGALIGLSPWYVPESWLTGESAEKGHYKLDVEASCD